MLAVEKKLQKNPAKGTGKARIFVVDDHALLRRGLADLINSEPGMELCGEAANLGDAYSEISRVSPDLVIVDVSLDGNDGVELTKELKRRWENLLILAYSMHEEEIYAERLLRAGARGYVMKKHPPETLLDAMKQILAGKTYLSERMADRLIGKASVDSEEKESGRTAVNKLSDRELEVFRLIGQGMSTANIADKLCLSVKTIETYREHLKQKLNLESGVELVRYAVEWIVKQS